MVAGAAALGAPAEAAAAAAGGSAISLAEADRLHGQVSKASAFVFVTRQALAGCRSCVHLDEEDEGGCMPEEDVELELALPLMKVRAGKGRQVGWGRVKQR